MKVPLPVANDSIAALRASVAAGHAALRTAALAVTDRWEEGCLPPDGPEVNPRADGSDWSPRRAFTHVVGSERMMAEYPVALARAGATLAPLLIADWRAAHAEHGASDQAEHERFTDAGAAIALAEPRWRGFEGALATLRATDLDLTADMTPVWPAYLAQWGFEAPATLRTVLTVLACHLHDHARQIGRGAPPA